MKLNSITLNDIRRFTSPVQVTGIGVGLNVMSAPNEEGKSTLFDALQAMFFQPHRSKGKEISALRPHAGGAPVVIVELTTAEGTFRLVKRWFSKPLAEVWAGPRLIAKADEAEAWIARLTQGKGDGGPAGLLWVRQGVTGLDQGSKAERDQAQGARRDLMSSVTGEVESLTGGRRMELAIDKCRTELERYVTNTGRPKAGGPLKAAEDDVTALAQRQGELSALVETLRRDLDRRRVVKRDLDELRAPDAIAERRARVETARAYHTLAQGHVDKTARQLERVIAARMALTSLRDRLAVLRSARGELNEAERLANDAGAFDTAARAAQTLAEAALAGAQSDADAARAAYGKAEAVLRLATKAETARNAETRRTELDGKLALVQGIETTLVADRKAAALGPDASALARLEAAAQEVIVLEKLRESAAPDILMAYAAGVTSGISRDGEALPGGERLPIPDGATLEIAGLGQMTIRPGKTADDARKLKHAKAELAAALSHFDQPDMEAARHAASLRAEAERRVAQGLATLAGLAPKGVATLKADRDALPESVAVAPDLPAPDAAQQEADRSATTRDAADTALETARRKAEQDRQAAARAAGALEGAAARLVRAKTAIATFDAPESMQLDLVSQEADAEADLRKAEAAHRNLADAAPDLSAAAAALSRAESVAAQTESEAALLATELSSLSATIDLRSGEGVEEELADVTEQLDAAEKHLTLLRFEVAVLQELSAALDLARASARDRYFEPVMAELKPLLRLLWPDAELRFDGDSILPTALIREGQAEEIDVLSGGTQEQIALMVRLAFAHMLAASGRHAPVILDDALVYTDDDRIERMFDALHQQASELQIIVLSCRQRAFRDLGGQKLSFVPCQLPADLG